MNLTLVDVGIAPNDGTGDNIREAFVKVNQNTQALDNLLYVNPVFDTALIETVLTVAGNLVVSQAIELNSAINSTSPTTGAFTTGGGIGLVKDLHVGGDTYSTNGTFSNDVLVQGNLTVEGTLTTINSSTLDVVDLNITVAKNASSAAQADGAGLTVGGSGATITYIAAEDKWAMNKGLVVDTVFGNISGTSGNINSLTTHTGTFTNVIANGIIAGNVTSNITSANIQVTGGSVNGVVIGANDPRNGTFANLTAINGVTGTLMTQSQPNINVLGDLLNLRVLGNAVIDGTLTASFTSAEANVTVISTGNAQITGGDITNTPISGSTGNFTTVTATNGNVSTLLSDTINATTINGTTINGAIGTAAQPNITSLGTLTGLSTSGSAVIGNDLTVNGNLLVLGTTSTLNTTVLEVTDINVTVAKNATSAAQANGAGLTVAGAGATFTYTTVDDRWNLNKDLTVGNVYGNLSGTVTTAGQPNITSVGTLTSVTVTNDITSGSGNVVISSTGKGIVYSDGSHQTTKYILPTASPTVLGGVKVGSGLDIDVDGVLFLNTSGGTGTFTDLIVSGNLTVNGSTTELSTASLNVTDINVTIAKNATNAAAAEGAGITINGPTVPASLTYSSTNDRWVMNKNLTVGTVFGALSGNATTASQLATARSIAMTGDATWSTTFSGGSNVSSAITLASTGVVPGTYTSVTVDAKGRVTSASTALSVTSIEKTGADGFGDIGQIDNKFGTIYGIASTALYADLAEKYESDRVYPPGTVVVFGGTHEITQSTTFADVSVAGVISTAPAYLMNSDSDGQAVALKGKVPIRVVGKVNKGDLLVSSYTPGCAMSVGKTVHPVATIAKALQSSTDEKEKVIYAVVI
jgi:hypothetical protein